MGSKSRPQKSSAPRQTPKYMARQITLWAFKQYSHIPLSEFLSKRFCTPESSPNYSAMLASFSKFCAWIGTDILTKVDDAQRAESIAFYIRVAEHCTHLRNYHSAFGIVGELNRYYIQRLRKTWSKVPKRLLSRFQRLVHLYRVDGELIRNL